MHFKLIKTNLLQPLALSGLMTLQSTQAATTLQHDGSALLAEKFETGWTLVTAFSYSFFNRGYDNWQKESVDLYRYFPKHQILLGAGVDLEHRSMSREDIVYGFNAAWHTTENLELHGSIELTQDADFLPSNRYGIGMKYRVNSQLELLFDVKQMEFDRQVAGWDDDITQIQPGLTWWFNEHNRVTLRYTHGWVHNDTDYDYYSAKFHFDQLIGDGTLSVGLAYGSDPDFSFGSATTTLSDSYLLSVFYTKQVNPDIKVFFGVEYVYRQRSDSHSELYQMLTPTIGLSCNF